MKIFKEFPIYCVQFLCPDVHVLPACAMAWSDESKLERKVGLSSPIYQVKYSKKDENLEKKVGLFSLILYHGKYSILVKFQSCRERSKKKGWTFKPYHVIDSKTNNMNLRIKTQPDATVQYVSGFLITSIWP